MSIGCRQQRIGGGSRGERTYNRQEKTYPRYCCRNLGLGFRPCSRNYLIRCSRPRQLAQEALPRRSRSCRGTRCQSPRIHPHISGRRSHSLVELRSDRDCRASGWKAYPLRPCRIPSWIRVSACHFWIEMGGAESHAHRLTSRRYQYRDPSRKSESRSGPGN